MNESVRIARERQINFGKMTIGYARYIEMCPKQDRIALRKKGIVIGPDTPRINQKCSKRNFEGQVHKWRRDLHAWDPKTILEVDYYIQRVLQRYPQADPLMVIKTGCINVIDDDDDDEGDC